MTRRRSKERPGEFTTLRVRSTTRDALIAELNARLAESEESRYTMTVEHAHGGRRFGARAGMTMDTLIQEMLVAYLASRGRD